MRLLEVFHEHGDDHVDQHELRHQHEYDEEHGSDAGGHATVFHAVRRVVAVLAQRVLHDAVPVVAGGHPEQRQERHAEVTEMSVFAQALAHVLLAALCGRNTRARVVLELCNRYRLFITGTQKKKIRVFLPQAQLKHVLYP